jgi:hypothetical protein
MGLEITEQGEITIYTFTDSSDAAVDEWAASLESLFNDTPVKQPLSVMVDVSSPDVEFTALARQKSAEIFPRYRTHRGRVAFVFSGITAPHYARIFFAGLGRLEFDVEFFDSHDAGLKWLRGQ